MRDCQGSAWAFHRLMQIARSDIEQGKASPARVIFDKPVKPAGKVSYWPDWHRLQERA